jgi:hypothetical protein
MTLETDLCDFVHQLKNTRDSASDLWTWLPSKRKAEQCLGDYYCNVRPSNSDIMKEACDYIADKCDPSKERLDSHYLYQCPCNGDCPKAQ